MTIPAPRRVVTVNVKSDPRMMIETIKARGIVSDTPTVTTALRRVSSIRRKVTEGDRAPWKAGEQRLVDLNESLRPYTPIVQIALHDAES